MDDTQRTDLLARMGLKAIMAAFNAHPLPVRIEPEDILLKIQAYDIVSDTGGESEDAYGERLRVAQALLQNMYNEGVFRGVREDTYLSSVTLAPHVRNKLTTRTNFANNPVDYIRDVLEQGHEENMHTAAMLAREIGFEP